MLYAQPYAITYLDDIWSSERSKEADIIGGQPGSCHSQRIKNKNKTPSSCGRYCMQAALIHTYTTCNPPVVLRSDMQERRLLLKATCPFSTRARGTDICITGAIHSGRDGGSGRGRGGGKGLPHVIPLTPEVH